MSEKCKFCKHYHSQHIGCSSCGIAYCDQCNCVYRKEYSVKVKKVRQLRKP
jgi:hypothetical protein